MGSSGRRWQEHALSRRQFLRTAARVTGAMLGAGLWFPPRTWARHHVPPQPIPGGQTATFVDEQFFIHHYPLASGNEPSAITDLHGFVGNTRVRGTGVGRNTDTGEETDLLFWADMASCRGITSAKMAAGRRAPSASSDWTSTTVRLTSIINSTTITPRRKGTQLFSDSEILFPVDRSPTGSDRE